MENLLSANVPVLPKPTGGMSEPKLDSLLKSDSGSNASFCSTSPQTQSPRRGLTPKFLAMVLPGHDSGEMKPISLDHYGPDSHSASLDITGSPTGSQSGPHPRLAEVRQPFSPQSLDKMKGGEVNPPGTCVKSPWRPAANHRTGGASVGGRGSTRGSHKGRSIGESMINEVFDLDEITEDFEKDQGDTADLDPHVFRIVLTGGPCGGKTTALSTIADYLRSLGTQVFMVPENATIFANGGAGFPVHSSKAQQMCWESSRIMCQMMMEDSFIRIAKSSGKPTVVLCDRGTMDAAAYMETQRWNELIDQMGWMTDGLREERYDAVIHLHTTAIGAEDYYTLQNNEARRENIDEARELDHKIKRVWMGHPHIEYIDNSTDFPEKIIRVVEAICRILGLHAPTSSGFFKVFRISREFKDAMPQLYIRFEEFFVQTTFLKNSSPENSQSIRHRKQRDHASELSLYTFSSRKVLPNRKVAIEERAITAKEYVALHQQVSMFLLYPFSTCVPR